jgi:hypothetical protein
MRSTALARDDDRQFGAAHTPLTQLPQITPENNFSRTRIGDGFKSVRAEHAKADVV